MEYVPRSPTGQMLPGHAWANKVGESLPPPRHPAPPYSIIAPLRRILGAGRNEHGEGKLAIQVAEVLAGIVTGDITAKDLDGARFQLQAILGIVDRVDGALIKGTAAAEARWTKRIVLEERPPQD